MITFFNRSSSKASTKIYPRNSGVASIAGISILDLRGYIFVEAFDEERLKNVIKTISYARNMLEGEIPIDQIEHFLTPASAVAKITEGDTVEMVSGPFRGEKAKITHIDYSKEEITVELLDSMVPIPITVRGEQVRVIKRKDDDEQKGGEAS